MPRKADKIHIPLKTDTAIAGLLKVKPTAQMPKPGATGKKRASKKNEPAPSP